ncbi:MAG TPA: alpha-isopropylmalate synthase regulatory domain-containing protein [Candidatus Dormibacteraeota bacterium]|nr:alpha-isopropylmalate synthase regulatory domain-containing protein [Candidatus Dormibacteraeota bacterium]
MSDPAAATVEQGIRLARWSVATGSNVQSRGVVIVESGDHQWEGTAEGNGAIDALLRAVDEALHDVLQGHPRLLAYDVHAVAEGPDAAGRVTVQLAPPGGATGRRARGVYEASTVSTNIVAASIEAYLEAINLLLAEAHWAGATSAAANRGKSRSAGHAQPAAEYDEAAAEHDTTAWFER